MGRPAFMYFIRYISPYILFLILSAVVFVYLYFGKPSLVIKKSGKDIVIDWEKFIPYYFLFCLIIAIVIWYIMKRYILRMV